MSCVTWARAGGALAQGQEIADTNRAAAESAIEQYLGIQKQAAAFISLPTFPLGVDAARLQRVVSAMTWFGLLPQAVGPTSRSPA